MCAGQVSDETIEKLKSMLEHDPENVQTIAAIEHCKQTLGRPNQADTEKAQNFFL